MNKIWVSGPSGSGKTTFSETLGTLLKIPVYYRDQISWGPYWEAIPEEDQISKIKDITPTYKWIFDGNRFTSSRLDGRLVNCDTLIHLDINRFVCLFRGIKRFIKHRNKPRKDLPENCKEEYSFELVRYVLYGYPQKRKTREKLFTDAKEMGKKVVILRNNKEIYGFLNNIKQN